MRYAIYGAGSECNKYSIEFLEKIEAIIDNNKMLHGKHFKGGAPIVPIESININGLVIIVSPIYKYYEIKHELQEYGLIENKDFIWGPNWYGNDEIPPAYPTRSWENLEKEKYDISKGLWDNRVEIMAHCLDDDIHSVIDLGAGGMTLKKFLKGGVEYIPVDYFKRFDETIVYDLNKGEFPIVVADAIVCSGILEYIDNAEYLIEKIAQHCRYAVVSYSPIEVFNDFALRHLSGWRNSYTIGQILMYFSKNGFELTDELIMPSGTVILKYRRIGSIYKR